MASFAFNAITGDFYWSSPEFGVIGRKNVKSRGSEVSWEIRFALIEIVVNCCLLLMYFVSYNKRTILCDI